MEKKGTLEQKRRPKGDPNPQKGPLGDPGPLKGTHVGTVEMSMMMKMSLMVTASTFALQMVITMGAEFSQLFSKKTCISKSWQRRQCPRSQSTPRSHQRGEENPLHLIGHDYVLGQARHQIRFLLELSLDTAWDQLVVVSAIDKY